MCTKSYGFQSKRSKLELISYEFENEKYSTNVGIGVKIMGYELSHQFLKKF